MDFTYIFNFLVIQYSLVIYKPHKIIFHLFELLVLYEQFEEVIHLFFHFKIHPTFVKEFDYLTLVIYL